MRDLTNISSLIGSLNNNSNNFINLTDYKAIKSGSYGKLMKAYYADEAKTQKLSAKKNDTKKVNNKVKTAADNPELTKAKANADSLKTSASKLSSSNIWDKKDGKLDKTKVKDAVKDFVKSYNNVVEQSKKSGSKEVEKNTKWMTDLSDTLSKALDRVGVKVGEDKKLSFDEDKFDKATDKNLESMFKGTYSYAGQVEAKASGIASASLMNTSTYEKDGSTTATLASLFNTNI